MEVYTRGLFSKNTVDTIIAPSGSFGGTVPVINITKTRLNDPHLWFLGTNEQPGDYRSSGCTACHTVNKDEPQRGPYLGTIADTYKRPELAENILDPNKTIAQGFVTSLFEMTDGTTQVGFITTEAADKVIIRNVAAQEITLATADIKKRDNLPTSLMPPGLMLNFTAKEFASLLEYLQSLVKK